MMVQLFTNRHIHNLFSQNSGYSMNLISRFKKSVKNGFRAIWIKLWDYADPELKRMCVMASLYSVIVQCKTNECEKISHLNSNMKLVRDEAALRLPIHYGPYVWKGVIAIDKIDKADLTTDQFFMRLIRKTPCWMKYADDATFLKDLKTLFKLSLHEKCIPN